jgi:hypothetical protein
MPDQLEVPFEFLPLKPHEFDSLPTASGFEYRHEISVASKRGSMLETFDVVW